MGLVRRPDLRCAVDRGFGLGLAGFFLAFSSAATQETPAIEFTHQNCGRSGSECRMAYSLRLDHGEPFAIKIRSTPLNDFTYTIAGVAVAPDRSEPRAADPSDTTFTVKHDRGYGGYLVTIRRDSGRPSPDFPDATLVISVTTNQWIIGFAGGFPVSTLSDHRFSLRDTLIDEGTKYRVDREEDREDALSLHTATFIHVSHTKVPWLAGSFGLGVGSETAYFAGLSWRLGDVAALTFGPIFASQDDLPTGLRLGDVTTDGNALASLPKRNVVRFFGALSFTFLGSNRSELEKPFKGSSPGNPGPAATPSVPLVEVPSANPTSTLSLVPAAPAPGQEVTFSVTLFAKEGQTFETDSLYAVDLEPPFEGGPTRNIQLKALDDGGRAQGEFRAKLKPDASGRVSPTVTISYKGEEYRLTAIPFESPRAPHVQCRGL